MLHGGGLMNTRMNMRVATRHRMENRRRKHALREIIFMLMQVRNAPSFDGVPELFVGLIE
jgi:hypothetical protein